VNTYKAFDVEIRGDDGDVLISEHVQVSGPLMAYDVSKLHRQVRIPYDQCGYAHISASPVDAEIHDLVDDMMLFGFYSHDNHMLDTVEAGTSPYADYVPVLNQSSDDDGDKRKLAYRAKKFVPFVSNDKWKLLLWTVNAGWTRNMGPATLTLSRRCPGKVDTRYFTLAPWEAKLWDIEEIFAIPLNEARRGSQQTIWLESRDANIFGIYVLEDRFNPMRFGLDHLTGG